MRQDQAKGSPEVKRVRDEISWARFYLRLKTEAGFHPLRDANQMGNAYNASM